MSRALPFTVASMARAIKGVELAGRFVIGVKPDGTLIVGNKPLDAATLVPEEQPSQTVRRFGERLSNGGDGAA